jgi:hypothetical protein
MQKLARVLLAVWFGFFGAFLVGAAGKSLQRYPSERFVAVAMVVYGLLFLACYPVLSRPRWLKLYRAVMTLGALSLSGRLVYVAANRPSAYSHWDDWLLLGFLLLGAWSAVPAVWWLFRSPSPARIL